VPIAVTVMAQQTAEAVASGTSGDTLFKT